MNEQELRARKAEIEAQFGPWTADNIPLAHGIVTNPQRACPHLLIRRTIQTIADFSMKPWNQLRILDLGSLEGIYSLEFASHGAEVVAIEGRESNNAHARFAAEVLDCRNVEFITDDVRNLSREKYGQFDVVFCSGILYHLTGADACGFLRSITKVCKRLTIIDTHVGLKPEHSIRWEGHSYSGFVHREHGPRDAPDEKASRKWSSLDNETSFWFTKPSLLNLLRDVGFTSAFEILNPKGFSNYSDRLTFAAIIGQRQTSAMSPELSLAPEPDWPEHSTLAPHAAQAGTLTRAVAQARAVSRARPFWPEVARRLRRAVGI
jgi:SAM-dependent methyltransferase